MYKLILFYKRSLLSAVKNKFIISNIYRKIYQSYIYEDPSSLYIWNIYGFFCHIILYTQNFTVNMRNQSEAYIVYVYNDPKIKVIIYLFFH